MKITRKNCIIELIQGDITTMRTDAIVNAANERLVHGGGVAGAIRRAGGETIQTESSAWVAKNGPVKTGSAAITGGGSLPARYVIHAVGPIMGSGNEEEKLHSATQSALHLAEAFHLSSITFPAISTGIFGYPVAGCAAVMLRAVFDFLPGARSIKYIAFCLFDNHTLKTFETELDRLSSNS